MSIKHAILGLLGRTRAHRWAKVRAAVEEMDPATQQEFWRFLQCVQEDARSSGRSQGSREPWRR